MKDVSGKRSKQLKTKIKISFSMSPTEINTQTSVIIQKSNEVANYAF